MMMSLKLSVDFFSLFFSLLIDNFGRPAVGLLLVETKQQQKIKSKASASSSLNNNYLMMMMVMDAMTDMDDCHGFIIIISSFKSR